MEVCEIGNFDINNKVLKIDLYIHIIYKTMINKVYFFKRRNEKMPVDEHGFARKIENDRQVSLQ